MADQQLGMAHPVVNELFGAAASFPWSRVLDAPVYDPWHVVTMVVFAAALASLGEWLRPRPAAAERESRIVVAALVAVAVGTVVVFAHIVRSDVSQLLIRWDHLVFVAFAGYLLARAPLAVRAWSLTLLSTGYVAHATGVVPFAVVVGGALCGFVAFRLLQTAPARTIAVVQGGLLLLIWATCWWLRTRRGLDGLSAHGLFAWVWLRHVSFVVHAPRDRPVPLGSYLCFLLFYPSCFGASEVWPEFAARNLSGEPPLDYPGAARRIIMGALCFWAGGRIPPPSDPITGDAAGLVLWAGMMVTFVRSSLFLMGIWITLEGVALFYGVRTRPNFRRLLSSRRPSEFWRAWRGTMTNWLIQYVYIPLGGNRRLQMRNIVAVFVVSTLWHCSALPIRGDGAARLSVPIGAWGALNACVIVGEVVIRRNARAVAMIAAVPAVVRIPMAVVATAFFGSFTVVLLGFEANTIDRFPGFLRRLVAIRGW